jgi:hypothetical protein
MQEAFPLLSTWLQGLVSQDDVKVSRKDVERLEGLLPLALAAAEAALRRAAGSLSTPIEVAAQARSCSGS